MVWNTEELLIDKKGNPVPQFLGPDGKPQALLGRNGANRVEFYGPDGNPIGSTGGKLDVRAGELEALLGALDALAETDPAAASAATNQLLRGLLKQMQGGGTGSLPVAVTGSLASDATFHNAATVAAVGSEFTVPAGYKDLTVKVMGTATSCQVQFEGLAVGGSTYEPIMGVRALDFACSTIADQIGESWYVPIGGFDKIRMNLLAVAGGNVTVKGRAMP